MAMDSMEMNRSPIDTDPEEMERIVAQMSRIRREKLKQMREREKQFADFRNNQHAQSQQSKPPKTKQQMAQAREETYGTAEDKDRGRRREAILAERRARLRNLPVEQIWAPDELRRRRAVEMLQKEAQQFLNDMPPNPAKKHVYMEDSKAGIGRDGMLEGSCEVMFRCENLVTLPTKTPYVIKIAGHENDGHGWHPFGNTEYTDETVNPKFSAGFQFFFVDPFPTRLKIFIKVRGSSVNAGYVEVRLEEIVSSVIHMRERIEQEAIEEDANSKDEYRPSKWLPPKPTFPAKMIAEEDWAEVECPIVSDDPEWSAQLEEAQSTLVFVIRIEPTKYRPARQQQGQKQKSVTGPTAPGR